MKLNSGILSLRDKVEWHRMQDEAQNSMMRVLIADDEPRVRSALRLLLRQHPSMAVAGEADNVESALELTSRHRPDLVLLDWELSGRNGTSALKRLRAVRQGIVVIALSGRPEARRAALDAGVDAFVSKGDPPEQLLSMLQATLRTVSRTSSVKTRSS
ncbi:MAG: response regulator transcription factor [Chloroflexi bacterium]|nr:response regulator transcription factor [Chloroflexota bacterium]